MQVLYKELKTFDQLEGYIQTHLVEQVFSNVAISCAIHDQQLDETMNIEHKTTTNILASDFCKQQEVGKYFKGNQDRFHQMQVVDYLKGHMDLCRGAYDALEDSLSKDNFFALLMFLLCPYTSRFFSGRLVKGEIPTPTFVGLDYKMLRQKKEEIQDQNKDFTVALGASLLDFVEIPLLLRKVHPNASLTLELYSVNGVRYCPVLMVELPVENAVVSTVSEERMEEVSPEKPKEARETAEKSEEVAENLEKSEDVTETEKESDEKVTDEKESDEKESDEKESDEKESEEKESEEKESDEKESEEKESDEKESEEKESEEKESDEKESEEKESEEKESDEKESEEKESDEKESEEKESDEKESDEEDEEDWEEEDEEDEEDEEATSTMAAADVALVLASLPKSATATAVTSKKAEPPRVTARLDLESLQKSIELLGTMEELVFYLHKQLASNDPLCVELLNSMLDGVQSIRGTLRNHELEF